LRLKKLKDGNRLKKGDSLEVNPAKVVLFGYLSVILAGTLLLKLPASTVSGILSWSNAFFMATSAVCVTGLTVIDVGADLTFQGQMILLSLFQMGGLGIMTLSIFFILFFKRGMSLSARLSASGISKKSDIRSLMSVLPFIFGMTILLEALGAFLLYFKFREHLPFPDAVFSSVFHAVSAFCNAGFGLYGDSLIRFQNSPYVLSILMALIVFGGLGFVVIDETATWFRSKCQRKPYRFSLHTKVCLAGTGILIVVGAIAIFFFENQNLLKQMAFPDQLMNSLFLSITARTAGFNTLHTSSLTNASLFFTMLYMFIGGCPGSTAGGIKVTTFAVLLALIKCQIRGQTMTSIGHRKIPREIVAKSLAVFAAGFLTLIAATLIFEVSENIGASATAPKKHFINMLFDTVSALGTVGLSTGITPSLSLFGKGLTALLMFAGRVGPLTIGLALMNRQRKQLAYEYAEEELMIA
jgi:trk system potassium uptake protein TrkH